MADLYASTRKIRESFDTVKYILLAVLLMLLIAGIGATIFFKVSEIEITGLSAYSKQDIIDASGVELGDSLFLVNENKAVIEIRRDKAYIKDVQVVKSIPGKVSIHVTEYKAVAYLKLDRNYWTLESGGKLLKREDMPPVGLVYVTGVTPINPAEGVQLSLGEAGTVKLAYLTNFLTAAEKEKVIGNISNIDMSNEESLAFTYLGRFKVNFGRADNAEARLKLVVQAAGGNDISSGATGTIEVVSDTEVRFVPD